MDYYNNIVKWLFNVQSFIILLVYTFCKSEEVKATDKLFNTGRSAHAEKEPYLGAEQIGKGYLLPSSLCNILLSSEDYSRFERRKKRIFLRIYKSNPSISSFVPKSVCEFEYSESKETIRSSDNGTAFVKGDGFTNRLTLPPYSDSCSGLVNTNGEMNYVKPVHLTTNNVKFQIGLQIGNHNRRHQICQFKISALRNDNSPTAIWIVETGKLRFRSQIQTKRNANATYEFVVLFNITTENECSLRLQQYATTKLKLCGNIQMENCMNYDCFHEAEILSAMSLGKFPMGRFYKNIEEYSTNFRKKETNKIIPKKEFMDNGAVITLLLFSTFIITALLYYFGATNCGTESIEEEDRSLVDTHPIPTPVVSSRPFANLPTRGLHRAPNLPNSQQLHAQRNISNGIHHNGNNTTNSRNIPRIQTNSYLIRDITSDTHHHNIATNTIPLNDVTQENNPPIQMRGGRNRSDDVPPAVNFTTVDIHPGTSRESEMPPNYENCVQDPPTYSEAVSLEPLVH